MRLEEPHSLQDSEDVAITRCFSSEPRIRSRRWGEFGAKFLDVSGSGKARPYGIESFVQMVAGRVRVLPKEICAVTAEGAFGVVPGDSGINLVQAGVRVAVRGIVVREL